LELSTAALLLLTDEIVYGNQGAESVERVTPKLEPF
jgi:hypothetical protein